MTILLFIPIITAALFSRTGNLAFNISKIWAIAIKRALFVKTTIVGKEKIQKGVPYVIISNHQSHIDIPAIITQLGIQFRWIIKKELLFIPLFGYALYASRNVFIKRSDRSQTIKSIQNGLKRLPIGVGLLFFAEGTRSPDGKIHSFKKGAFVTALEAKLPILPITINGSRKVLPKGSVIFSPGLIEVVVGDPIDSTNYSYDKLEELIEKTRKTIVNSFSGANQ